MIHHIIFLLDIKSKGDNTKLSKINRIKFLVHQLNYYRNQYYNNSVSAISDQEYDEMFDELQELEQTAGFIMSNSPTQTVGYDVVSELQKVKHSHPMLSLSKTKSLEELNQFVGGRPAVISCKLDGLTVLLTYEDGELVQAETRGNGELGELITHNAKVFDNIPLHIDQPGHFEVEGEAIITYEDFEHINAGLREDQKYKNPRNLASGSVRQLDSSIASTRHLKFIAWKVPEDAEHETMNERLDYADALGFDVVPWFLITKIENENLINILKECAKQLGYPIDGMVVTYDDIKYGESLGMTGHHPKHSIAFKFYDETVETELIDIEWTMGKTGVLTPVAVFKPVEIDGTTVERANLHNLSVMMRMTNNKPWYKGIKIFVYKANMIIPQVANVIYENSDNDDILEIPDVCPICRMETGQFTENRSTVLMCTNPNCKGKLLGVLKTFCSKQAHDIKGLSEATLELMINNGYLNGIRDLFYLKNYKTELTRIPGLGAKKVDGILKSIEDCRKTTLSKFICGLSIPLFGVNACKEIERYETNKAKERGMETAWNAFWDDIENRRCLSNSIDGFGRIMDDSFHTYMDANINFVRELSTEFVFDSISNALSGDNSLNGKKICITGSLSIFKNRDELVKDIESHGGKVVSSVSSKTDYLLTNDKDSGSSKNQKAKELNIPIISEVEYRDMIIKN